MKKVKSGRPAAPNVSLATKVEVWPIARLRPYARNARLHPTAQIRQLADGILKFGFRVPIEVNTKGVILAGHGRLAAAELLGMQTVPVIVSSHLTEDQQRAYRLANNQLGLGSEWDAGMLAEEIRLIESGGTVDLALLAFDDEELAGILAPKISADKAADKDPEDIPALPVEPVCQLGDLWILGAHRLLVGDSKADATRERIMDGELADMVFTDPPYNVAYQGYTDEKMTISSDDMSLQDFKLFLRQVFRQYSRAVKRHASIYVFHPSSFQREFQNAMQLEGFEVRYQIIWAKSQAAWGQGRLKFQHEPLFYGHVSGQKDRWFGDKKQTTLWEVAKPVANRLHPTAKPVELVERALALSSRPGELVLDLFGGSGSTMIGCERQKRRARTVELDPKYADAIVRRWQELTGENAYLLDSGGKTYAEVMHERVSEEPAPEVAHV